VNQRIKTIKFTPDLLKAIKDGVKTQTRRVMDPMLVRFIGQQDLVEQCPYVGWSGFLEVEGFPEVLLFVENIKIERLKDISHENALAEGVKSNANMYQGGPHRVHGYPRQYYKAEQAFFDLWDSIYGENPVKKSASNPWVWVIEFSKVEVPY